MTGLLGLTIPAPVQWLSSNDRVHWRKRADLVRQWRLAANLWAKGTKLPKGLDRIRVEAVLVFRDKRKRDPHNYMPTLKAVIDGLVDYGLIVDDDPVHLDGPHILGAMAETFDPGQHGVLSLTIREAPRG